jgi:hypothetical protein
MTFSMCVCVRERERDHKRILYKLCVSRSSGRKVTSPLKATCIPLLLLFRYYLILELLSDRTMQFAFPCRHCRAGNRLRLDPLLASDTTVGDFPEFLHKLDDLDNFGLRINEAEVSNFTKAYILILNHYRNPLNLQWPKVVANKAFAIVNSLFMMASHNK